MPDEETAIKIAEAVWLPIYGDSIYDGKPFGVNYNEADDTWQVIGGAPNSNWRFGGYTEIIINRSDGRIIYVAQTR